MRGTTVQCLRRGAFVWGGARRTCPGTQASRNDHVALDRLFDGARRIALELDARLLRARPVLSCLRRIDHRLEKLAKHTNDGAEDDGEKEIVSFVGSFPAS